MDMPMMPELPGTSNLGSLTPVDSAPSVPSQQGVLGGNKGQDFGLLTFEDYFPKLELDTDQKEALVSWFEKDLRSCIKHINNYKDVWAKYRAVYMLDYVEKFYPDMGIGADFASGLLCEKVLEGMNRLKKAVYSAHPLFAVNTKVSGGDIDIDLLMRAQWALHTVMVKELGVYDAVGDVGAFEFLLDGSLIMEADTMYEKIPQRTLKTYTSIEQLMADADKVLDESHYESAMQSLDAHGVARVLIEEDIITKNGLQLFHVDKVDHLIPEGVLYDKDLRFRARRMYLTSSDLRLLASDNVGWYDSAAVDEVLNGRQDARTYRQIMSGGKKEDASEAMDKLRKYEESSDLSYQWQEEEDELRAKAGSQPYQETFAVYRITCKYGYRTKSDPKGEIPKYVLIDYSPESKQILRSVTYPHFRERPNWFHFKFGYAPRSYYGFGYGARLMQDDFLESNAVDLFMDSAALASFNPFLVKHPEAGGRVPFTAGYGPGKLGYVNDVNDFKQVQVQPPNEGLVRLILPLTQTRVSNRTSITSLLQGRTETADPRSPAQKTAMLIGQAEVGMDILLSDWNKTGWEPLAQYVWNAMYETAVYTQENGGDLATVLSGVVLPNGAPIPETSENQLTVAELGKDLVWESLASSDYLNPTIRQQRFLQLYNIFLPLLQQMAQTNPQVYKEYMWRWMKRASQELDLPGAYFLIPTRKELAQIPPEQMQAMMDGMLNNLKANQSQSGLMNTGGGSANS
jgi:hypothetical protein